MSSSRRYIAAVLVVAPFLALTSLWRVAACGAEGAAQPQRLTVYVGTYTGPNSEGIYRAELDLAAGKLSPATLAGKAVNPSFLAVHPNGRFLYAVGEIGNFGGGKTGAVDAFSIDPETGGLTLLNQQPSQGAGPCHLVVDRAGRFVLVANYGGGSVACLPIGGDGRLGKATCWVQHEGSSVNPQRQKGPHAHCINLDAANRFAYSADLGLDRVLIYRFDAQQGKLAPNDPAWARTAPGAGPRHLAFHPNGRFVYVINELDSTVTAFRCDTSSGALETLQTVSTLPQGFQGANWPAEIEVHPSGRFLYGSNRGHDSIAIFAVDPATGELRPAGHEPTRGKNPRNFAIDPTGAYLVAANQGSDSMVVFRIDPATGALRATGSTAAIGSPVCVLMMPPHQ